jgi:hypothetical protein
MPMLFICVLDELGGRPKPERDHAIIEANSRDQAFEKALQAWPDIDAVFSYEVPRKHSAKIPADLIGKRITKSVAERLRADCGIAEDDWWGCAPLFLAQQDDRRQRLMTAAGVDPGLLAYAAGAILAKFPGPVTLQLSMQEWAGAFFLLGLFLGLVTAALLSLSDPIGGADLGMYFAAGFLLIFSVLCMLVSEGLLTTRMTLDAAGFKMRSFGVVTYHRQWKDVRNFTPVTPNNIVVYEDSTRHGFWAEVDRRYLGGFNARLIDTFGLTVDELAGLMNAWRERALSQN